MTPHQQGDRRPTPRQLTYLRGLAERTGQTFTYPHTFAEARREIDRLKAAAPKAASSGGSSVSRSPTRSPKAPHDAARVRSSEITGYG